MNEINHGMWMGIGLTCRNCSEPGSDIQDADEEGVEGCEKERWEVE